MDQIFAGDFSLSSVKLYPLVVDDSAVTNRGHVDIKELVYEISIYESVISASLSCEIVIKDIGPDLISTLPLMGQEQVEINLSSYGIEYTLNFYIYKIDGRSLQEKSQTYVLHLVSLEALNNESNRIMERVKGVKSDEYLKKKFTQKKEDSSIFTNKKFISDPTLYPFDMYIPNWRLFDTAIWMSRRSISSTYKNSVGYLFFETIEGFNFRSIDILFNNRAYPNDNVKYTYMQGNTQLKTSSISNYRILNYSSPKVFDVFEDLRNGAFCHNSIYVDISNNVYQVFKSSADQYWNNMEHLEDLKPYRTKTPDKVMHYPTRVVYRPTTISTYGWKSIDKFRTQNDYMDSVNKNYEKSIYRYYFLEYNKIEIAIPGDLKLRAGMIINISLPSPRRSTDGRVLEDERTSGRYLVHSVRHSIINRTELRTNVTLTRDSFGGKNIADDKIKVGQVNLK